DLLRLFRKIWFNDTAAEKFVNLFIHAGIDHDVTVGIDHLKDRPCLNARHIRCALDGKILGAAALCEFQDIDPERPPSRDDPGGLADFVEIRCPDLSGNLTSTCTHNCC